MSVCIRLIGRPEICVDDAVANVRGHKPWALLARLLLAERPLERRQLAQELFPDAEDPLGSLRWSLAALRRALGSNTSLTGDPIELDLPPGTTVDLWALERWRDRRRRPRSCAARVDARTSCCRSTPGRSSAVGLSGDVRARRANKTGGEGVKFGRSG